MKLAGWSSSSVRGSAISTSSVSSSTTNTCLMELAETDDASPSARRAADRMILYFIAFPFREMAASCPEPPCIKYYFNTFTIGENQTAKKNKHILLKTLYEIRTIKNCGRAAVLYMSYFLSLILAALPDRPRR